MNQNGLEFTKDILDQYVYKVSLLELRKTELIRALSPGVCDNGHVQGGIKTFEHDRYLEMVRKDRTCIYLEDWISKVDKAMRHLDPDERAKVQNGFSQCEPRTKRRILIKVAEKMFGTLVY